MPQTLRPLGDRVLVRRHEETTTNKSGLLMPEGAKEKPLEGTILAVGNGRKLDNGSVLAVDLKEGMRVLFGKFAGSEIVVNRETLLLMREDEVMGEVMGELDAEAEPELPPAVSPKVEDMKFKKRRRK
jgi:chaperonin GroES